MATLLHDPIVRWAEHRPESEAFRFEGRGLTYASLARRSHRLANTLIEEGVRPSDRVAIYMLKGLELPVAIYGILTAGGVYVPIDPAAPQARVQSILEDCGIRHLVTNDSRSRRAAVLTERTPELECVVGASSERSTRDSRFIPWASLDAASAERPSVEVAEDDLAYIMYTSGSTGAPKGLMHTHASGMSYARMSAETYGVRPTDRLGNHSPLHFDMSTFEYLTGPLCGATTVIIPEEATYFPVSLAELIERERLTFWYSVPLALIQLATRGELERFDCGSLRWVLFGGEPFPPKHLWRLMELWPNARFSNSYGPAEVNQCTFYHVRRADKGSQDPIPIGRLWKGAEGLVVDDKNQDVESGEAGELLIRAPTMMRGYWGRPDLDQAAFFVQESEHGERRVFYRTGDLVRERSDGNLLFLGRKDRQVKVRGYRVELDEVENVLGGLNEVAEAAAVTVAIGEGERAIVGAVSIGHTEHADPVALKRQAAEHLPPYAVPQRIEIVSSFPRTGSGKIDRRALAASLEDQEHAR